MNYIIDNINEMTIEEAQIIRTYRVDKDYSWRHVASEAYKANILSHQNKNSSWSGLPSNQLAGMDLCNMAASMHGEHYMDEVWNG